MIKFQQFRNVYVFYLVLGLTARIRFTHYTGLEYKYECVSLFRNSIKLETVRVLTVHKIRPVIYMITVIVKYSTRNEVHFHVQWSLTESEYWFDGCCCNLLVNNENFICRQGVRFCYTPFEKTRAMENRPHRIPYVKYDICHKQNERIYRRPVPKIKQWNTDFIANSSNAFKKSFHNYSTTLVEFFSVKIQIKFIAD